MSFKYFRFHQSQHHFFLDYFMVVTSSDFANLWAMLSMTFLFPFKSYHHCHSNSPHFANLTQPYFRIFHGSHLKSSYFTNLYAMFSLMLWVLLLFPCRLFHIQIIPNSPISVCDVFLDIVVLLLLLLLGFFLLLFSIDRLLVKINTLVLGP